MRPYPSRRHGRRVLERRMLAWVMVIILVPVPVVVQAQTEPHPLDVFLTDILDFTSPAGIRGTIRYIDLNGPVVWLNWEQRSDEAPLFQTGWKVVPGEAILAVHPRTSEPVIDLRALRKGTAVELIIQLDAEGKRRILSFRDASQPPEVPL